MDIRDQIIHYRKQKNISRAKLAKGAGVSESLLVKYEEGKCNVSHRVLEGIVDFMELKLVLIDEKLVIKEDK